ncbi:MAG: TetR/AcrR family transcriptional regulator [Coriobacteriales bacterium]|nr:TetR/AcrR family transcriptional regulator [Coriobacteriales bacterium]
MTSDTFDNIVERCKPLLAKYGIHQLTMDRVANELHVSKRTIYEYIRSKEEFVDAVCSSFVEDDIRKTNAAVEAANTYPDKLRAACHLYALDYFDGKLPLHEELLELRERFPESWQKLQDISRSKFDTIKKIYKAGVKAGVFVKSIPDPLNPRKKLKVDDICLLISSLTAAVVGTQVNTWLTNFTWDVNELLAYHSELLLRALCVPQDQAN